MAGHGTHYVTIDKTADGFAIVTLKRDPVNSMNLDVWSQLGGAIEQCEADRSVRGVIIVSGLSKALFTAGNDITELYSKATNEERFTRFWHAQTSCLAKLYKSPLVTVAAIRGHCPAGGCILALTCDARVATDDAKLGLNEVALGISVPLFWVKVMALQIGAGRADALLQTATFVGAPEALGLGMVDSVVSTEGLMPAAVKEMKRRLAFPDSGRIQTKRFLRMDLADSWLAYSGEEARAGWAGLSSPATTAALGAVISNLSKAGSESKARAKL